MPPPTALLTAFRQRFAVEPPLIVRAPGRVNLIGEHTDYNEGFVLPMAIDRAVWIALRPRPDRQILAHSLDYDQTATLDLDPLDPVPPGWARYIQGVAWAFQEAGFPLKGWEGVLGGDVPQGAGLSSSAALEMAAARAFAALAGLEWDPAAMARIGQRAESEWVGVRCGIMDQMVSAAARAGHALFLDCRSLHFEHIPLPSDVSVVVLDTATRRGLVDSAYNERRAQCEAAAQVFGVRALREVDAAAFAARAGELEAVTRRRARHVVSENQRVLHAVKALQRGDSAGFGRLLSASHASLRDDFEVSSPALDQMVDLAMQQEECFGARMTGAGFGGCVVALVRAETVQRFLGTVKAAYCSATDLTPGAYLCRAADGAGLHCA